MKAILHFVLYLTVLNVSAQTSFTIEGDFGSAPNKEIRLMGFMGARDTLLSQSTTDASGNFTLHYPKKYTGAAVIQVKELTSLVVLLNQESFTLKWPDLKDFNSVTFNNSKENEWFQQAYTINTDAQKKLAGLKYLLPLYQKNPLKNEWAAQLENEINAEDIRFEAFLKQLPQSCAKDYLGYRALLQKLQVQNKTPQEDAATEIAFLAVDFSDSNLYHSGLAKDFFDEYIKQQLKISGKEAIISKFNIFSDAVTKSVKSTPLLLNDYTEYLIQQYEKYSITEAAEHLALSLLTNKCSIDSKRLPLLEQYKRMAIGNSAPALEINSNPKYKSLTDIQAKYKILVFGASWCEECKKELPQLKEYADVFKAKYDAEIIFVAIDTDKESYSGFTKDLPFVNTCDFKGWEGPNVKNYYVFATPSLFIIDKDNTIAAKPNGAIEAAKWLFEAVGSKP